MSAHMRSCALTSHEALAFWDPTCCISYRSLVSCAGWLCVRGRSKDRETIVLRHRLTFLHGHNNRPDVTDDNWAETSNQVSTSS